MRGQLANLAGELGESDQCKPEISIETSLMRKLNGRKEEMRNMLLAIAAALLVVAPVMADDSYESGDAAWTVGEPGGIPTWTMSRDVIYESGPLLTGVGTGVGGADESILQSVSLGMSTLGFGHQWALGYWIADAFEVPAGETWDIDQITFFAYQTGSPTQSTITGVYFEIREFDVAGPVVGGDMAINALVSTDWTGMYRVTETTTGVSADRPIMANVCSLDPVSLGEGIYTIVWTTDRKSVV